MSYFAAAFSRKGRDWQGVDVDLDEVESLDGLVDAVRDAAIDAGGDDEVLVVLLEQPDEWFGVVRVDADEDPLVFVSDCQAALRHALGEVLLPDLVPPVPEVEVAPVEADEADWTEGAEPDASDVEQAPSGPAGAPELLADLGLQPRELTDLARGDSPAEALATLAEQIGFHEALESVR